MSPLLAGSGPGVAPAGPIQSLALIDGSFEHDGVGWTLEGARSVDVGSGAYHGTRALLIDPGASSRLSQGTAAVWVPTEPGREYRLTFAYQTGFETGMPVLSVVLGAETPDHVAALVRFFDPGARRDSPVRSAWQEQRVSFFAEDDSTYIQIGPFSRWNDEIGWGKLWIDHVRLETLLTVRTLGRDLEVRATLPSVVQVGEEVELTVSLAGRLRRNRDSGGSFDSRALRHSCELQLTSDDPAATLPRRIRFENEATRVKRVRFGTPGVHRLTLSTADGFQTLSNPVRVVEGPLPMRAYWGDVHVHTNLGHSDWVGGDGAANYAFARDFADLDFAALSEHFSGAIATRWMDELQEATEEFNEPGRFVTFVGVESFTYQGHANHYLRGGDPLVMFDPRNRLISREAQLENLRTREARVLTIPHHFMLLDPADWRGTDRGALRLAEIYSVHGSSEKAGEWWRHPAHSGYAYTDSQGARGHDYGAALARGHRIGVIGCSDSHHLQPGMSGLTCVHAPGLERGEVWDGLHRRDCYATTGERILLDFEIAGAGMGREIELAPGTQAIARVEVHGTTPIESVEIVEGGRVVASARPGALDFVGAFDLGVFSGRPVSYYARVRQSDAHRAWTSPIWIDPVNTPNLAVERRDLRYEYDTGTLRIRAHNFGDLAATGDLDLYSSRTQPSLGVVDPGGMSEPALLLRVEPVRPGRVRLLAALYLPVGLRRTLRFSGDLFVQQADGGSTRIVADPRGMVRNMGAGRFTWNDLLGVEYLGLDSLSGQITDFELEIDTRPDTVVWLRPLLDGAEIGMVFVGSRLENAPPSVLLPIGQIARALPERHATVTVPARGAVEVAFPNLTSGVSYIAVLDSDGIALDSESRNNSAHLLVPGTERFYSHWPEFFEASQGLVFEPPFDDPSDPGQDGEDGLARPCCQVER